MKFTQKALEQVITELVGIDALPLVSVLKDNNNISEFKIATKIKTPVDVVRNQLYRLYNHNLVTFIRKKDKKKGWYIYYWTLNVERAKYLVWDIKKRRVEQLTERLDREEQSHFFSCLNNCIRVDFEQATNFEYRCPECGELLQQEDNQQKIGEIKKEIETLQKELEAEKAIREALEAQSAAEEEEKAAKPVKKKAAPKKKAATKKKAAPKKTSTTKKKVTKKKAATKKKSTKKK